MNSSRQSGSIASFIVIGLVLAGLLVAGLYFSKERGRVAVNGGDESSQQTEETKPDDNKEEANPETDGSNGTTNPQTDESTPPAATGQPDSDDQTPTGQTPSTAPATGPSEIASTGPEDTLAAQLIAILAVSLAIGSYTVSRRTYVRSARS